MGVYCHKPRWDCEEDYPCGACSKERGAEEGKKDDKDKPRVGLVPPKAALELAKVMTHGAEKYGDKNWRLVADHRYLDALGRHYLELLMVEGNGQVAKDHDSGLPILAHIAANALILLEKELTKGE